MSKKYGYETERMHEIFRLVLEGEEDPNEEETLYTVMEQFQELFEACFWVGISPLREMRRLFPAYNWMFIRSRDTAHIKRRIARSHLVWRVNWLEDNEPDEWAKEVQLVVAIKDQDSSPKKWFFAKDKNESEGSSPKLDFAREYGGDPIFSNIIVTST